MKFFQYIWQDEKNINEKPTAKKYKKKNFNQLIFEVYFSFNF